MTHDGYVDVADIKPCRLCGREILRVPQGAYSDAMPLHLEPFTVRGSDLPMGYTLRRFALTTFWATHVGSVAPDDYAFPLHVCTRDEPPPKRGDRMTDDVFGQGEKRPAVSFKGAPVGATITMTVEKAPELVRARNFETGQPDSWPDGNPKMTAVVAVLINGEPYSLWAAKPSSMFAALAAAQQTAGALIAPGGTLTVRYTGDKPNDNPRLSAQKLYEARYVSGGVFDAPASSAPTQEQPTAAATAAPPWST